MIPSIFEYTIKKPYSPAWDPKDRNMSSLAVLESKISDEFSMQVDFFED